MQYSDEYCARRVLHCHICCGYYSPSQYCRRMPYMLLSLITMERSLYTGGGFGFGHGYREKGQAGRIDNHGAMLASYLELPV